MCFDLLKAGGGGPEWGWGWLTGRRRRSRWILLLMLAEVLGRGERVVRLCFVVLLEEGEGGEGMLTL